MIAVLGAGPHGRQLAALVDATPAPCPAKGYELEAVLYDDNLPGYPPLSEYIGREQHGPHNAYLIGAAWPRVRRQIFDTVGWEPFARDKGIVIFPGARIGDEVTIGQHSHVGWNAVVSHGVTVGDFVNICPGAVIAGEATIGNDVFVGANASIIHGGIKIGDGAIIGAGAVVLSDVPAGMTYAGNPARYLGAA